ncbi:diaminopimelate epimerase [Rossellomorea vietnamensis]|uniref:diaminopimelate epimerase n=1 Tax=Rossellomorea vietnamensis TaxID=218284 RepID=UPI001E583C11|nr:diaminopimelate epimerase [Rossellomorea vietnamensis]MCC5801672.1 diaminopimelate epimerase [Rossellomorea vietnamensis]
MMQEIEFIKFNPTENMTVLVKTKHFMEEYEDIAAKIMAYSCLNAEQVGFIEEPQMTGTDSRLQMAGGEFCGNACMSLAAFIASGKMLSPDCSTTILMEVSGTDELVRCNVKNVMGLYRCNMTVPKPTKIEKQTWVVEGEELLITMIYYQEAVHAVWETGELNPSLRRKAETLAQSINSSYEVNLVGVLLYDLETGELSPLIYVPDLNSMMWERGCGSGTGSLGAYLAWKQQACISQPVKQPGGEMHVKTEWSAGAITEVKIEGTVGIVAEGKAFIQMIEEEVVG